ncbi:NB-ARC domain, LRR domain containing protein [Parasponia andersonii]|uniref:NB-ARC domain, LRR domain containing protein n=1 Tax=Parasponia andersonii TaxID=3476 RepID=A0A2P5DSN5_PARAD|nr:NB-ARC domain, LRR domain containing protein [Parasponia andersonii]
MERSIGLLIGKIATVVENEVSLLREFQVELEEIKNELEYMESFINDFKSKKGLSDVEKTLVKTVKEKAHDIVDIIDEYTYYTNKKLSWNMFNKAIHFQETLTAKHQLATKLQDMKRTIKEMGERNNRYYGSERLDQQGNMSDYDANWVTKSTGELALFQSDGDLVGIEEAKHELLDLLLRGGLDRTVISVLGMGGSGKTSLVASLLRSPEVKKHFSGFYAWITVSQTNYTIDNLLRSMVKEFDEREGKDINLHELNNMNQTELVKMIINKLQGKRYLVVLDDVWEIDNLWLVLRPAIFANTLGSRIILTTRKEDIANFSFGVRSHAYNLKPLPENKAWELFWKKALPHNPDKCSGELEQIARRLIKKCGGLPLGLAALGALMSTKKLETGEWRVVLHRLNWELNNNPRLNVVRSILLLSFYELPYRLKQCFLYCCIFPEDYVFNQGRLIRLWIAEGFVEWGRGVTQEKMAERYVIELVHRCMIQVSKETYSIQSFRIHDLTRELIVSISETEKFCHVYNGQEVVQGSRVYRLAMQANYREELHNKMSKVRSFFVFDSNMDTSSLQILLRSFMLLRVLDLKDAPIATLPKEVLNCYNLRYLSLKNTLVEKLPKSIQKLRNLQTLDIRQTKIRVLPDGITKLSNLRHLYARQYIDSDILLTAFNIFYSTQAPAGISELKNLQVLDSVEVGNDIYERLRGMTQLTGIGLTNVKEADGNDLCELIERMKQIDHLLVQASSADEVLRIDQVSLASPSLNKLYLIGKLEKTPRWFVSLQGLKILYLWWSKLSDDFLPHMSELPNLTILNLNNTYEGKQLWFRRGFGKLTSLFVCNFIQLSEIIIERGVMPGLEELHIHRCVELREMPRGLEHLTCLQEMYFRNVPTK